MCFVFQSIQIVHVDIIREKFTEQVNISHEVFLTRLLIDFVLLVRIEMAQCSIPKSLVRTGSTGEMNVFMVLEVKSTNELMVVSREQLPPALRLGKLFLKQKVTIRDSNRQNIESSIIFMRT